MGMLLLWNRGSLFSLKERYRLAKSRFRYPYLIGFIGVGTFFIFLAQKIYVEENIDKQALSAITSDQILGQYKEEWAPFRHISQPNITDLDLQIDFIPR